MAIETIPVQQYNAELPEGTPVKMMGLDSLFKTILCNPGLRNVGEIIGSDLIETFNAFGYCDGSDGSNISGVFLSIRIDIDTVTYYGFQLKIQPHGWGFPFFKYRTFDGSEAYEWSDWHTIVTE